MEKKTRESLDLSKINSTLAAKILGSVTRTRSITQAGSLFSLAETTAPLTKYERVGQKLNEYKDAVDSKLKDVRNKTVINLVFITATFVFLILALVYSNLASLVGSAGLGTTSLVAQATTWKDTLVTFVSDGGEAKKTGGLSRRPV